MHASRIVLVIAVIVEMGLITFWRKSPTLGAWGPFVFFWISLFIGLFPIFWIDYQPKFSIKLTKPLLSQRNETLTLLIVAILGLAYMVPGLGETFNTYPPTLEHSDIIPQIDVMVRKFFWEGETPYTVITEFGYPLFSPYMPFHWGPFVIPRLLGFDFRWLAYAVYCLAYVLFVFRISRLQVDYTYKVLFAIFPAVFIGEINTYMDTIPGHTVEFLIVGYYVILGLSLMSNSSYFRAVGILLCLLSRYTLVFWLPLYFLVIYQKEGSQKAWKMTAISFAGFCICYVFPFLWNDWAIFSEGLAHHGTTTFNGWTLKAWMGPDGKPLILSWGVGLGIYFFDLWPTEVLGRLKALENSQLIFAITTVAALAWGFWKEKITIPYKLFLLLSLKVYLVIFYHLNALPFVYYFLVPAGLSVLICAYVIHSQVAKLE